MKRDPMEEFFELTCKSIILNSPHMNAICTVNTKEMYKKALQTSLPFFKWGGWIEETVNKEFLRTVLRQGKGKKTAAVKEAEKKTMFTAEQAQNELES